MSGMPRVRSPEPKETLTIYNSYSEISNSQIRMLFGRQLSGNTITKLKNLAREQMDKDGKLAFRPGYVNTKSAFTGWGIDITEVEEGFKKLQKLKLAGNVI